MNKAIKFVKPNFLKNIILLIITLSLVYIAGEVLFRYYFYNQLGYRLDKIEYLHNPEGLRDYEHSLEKADRTIRILILGDSFTYGQGVKDFNKTFPSLLEKMLNERQSSLQYEIINFGVPGSNEVMKIDNLKQKGLKYKPDIVIFQHRSWGGNNNLLKKYGLNDRIQLEATKHKLYFLLWMNKIRHILFKEKYNIEWRNYSLDMYGLNSNNRLFLEKTFEELNNISKEYNFKVVCVDICWLQRSSWKRTYDYQKHSYQFIKEVCEKNGFYFLDMYDSYSPYSVEELRISSIDAHPNEKGHKLIAETIYDFLIKEKIVKDFEKFKS